MFMEVGVAEKKQITVSGVSTLFEAKVDQK